MVPGTKYKLQLQDSRVARMNLVGDFTKHCERILREAMKWAPAATASHLQVNISAMKIFYKKMFVSISLVLISEVNWDGFYLDYFVN